MNNELYENLNILSNNEFENISYYTPLEEYLDLSINRHITSYHTKINENNFYIKDKDTTNTNLQQSFVKYIPLVDFLKYLIGKYKKDNLDILPNSIDMSKNHESKYEKCIYDVNNYSYVDSFFYYITSELKTKHNFIHGIECFDNFICMKKNCRINIADDIEYLCDSSYFNDNLDKLYYFDDDDIKGIFSQNKKEKIIISQDCELLNIEEIDDNDIILQIENVNENNDNDNLLNLNTENDEYESNTDEESNNENDDDDNDDDDDTIEPVMTSDDESDCESEYDDEDESDENEDEEIISDESEDESEDEDELYLNLKKIPTQVVVLEKCENTLDYLLENDLLTIEELESVMFQIVTILYTYQTIFRFTHNDLHTNNIMYINTDQEYLFYKIKDKTYKVPTFGKIYKIIDFGRAIYYVKDKLLCSDSFSSNGTAHTQYNFGPYYNEKKPILEPNYSFDLCRLAGSIFDFICDDIKNINKFREATPVYDLIFSWLYDDNGRNILYKSNGEDKYPGFRLYKAISKIVHNHIPEKQYNHVCLKKFEINQNKGDLSLSSIMDIDSIKSSVHL